MKCQWWERLKRYHWLPERLKEGPRGKGPSKDGKPSEAWLDAYTGFVEKQQLCFLAGHHVIIFGLSPWIWWTGGHQPLVGVKGTRQEWSNSKASWLSALAEGDGHINKIIQDHIHGDHADSGRRNIKLNCRDADARVGWGRLMSPKFPSWMLTSQSGNTQTKGSEGTFMIQSCSLLPYICRMEVTEECELVFLNPLKNIWASHSCRKEPFGLMIPSSSAVPLSQVAEAF